MAARFKVKGYEHPHFIRAWRKHRGLSQDRLAEDIGVSKATISRLENGEQPYSQDLLEAISRVLATDPASLLIRAPDDSEGLWALWRRAQPGERRQIEEIARVVLRTGTDG